MIEPYRSLYSILLRCGGKVVDVKKVGESYVVFTKWPVETENMDTGEIWNSEAEEYFILSPVKGC